MKSLSILLILLSLSQIAKAAEDLSCLSGTVEQQFSCVEDTFKLSEQVLNQTYQKIVAALENKQEYGKEKNFIYENMVSRLRISQRSWLYFRAGQCEMESFSKINKQHVISAQLVCNTKLNFERTTSLKETFSDYLKMTF